MMTPTRRVRILAAWLLVLAAPLAAAAAEPVHDLVITNGTVYDGSGGEPYRGEVAVDGDRIAYVGPPRGLTGRRVVDARGRAVAPGFINMLSWSNESLLVDGLGQSELRQGVTLQVMGEGSSMGPWTEAMKAAARARQGDLRYDIAWTTLGEYLAHLERRGVAQNVASFVGAETVRVHVLGEGEVQPAPAQLAAMQALVRQAMEEGALGVGSSLIYAPGAYATTAELAALATVAGQCGGLYITHLRSEGDRLVEAVEEAIAIARTSGAPAEIYHLKAAGRDNWDKLPVVLARIEAARAAGLRITTDMYTYTAGATGLDAAMPPWVQAGGVEQWIARLRDPAIRARVLAEMRDPAAGFENLLRHAGPDNALLLGFKNPALKPLTGRTLAEVARERGRSPEDTAIDLVIEDGSRVATAYTLMSEDNVRRQLQLPYMSFGSDATAQAPEGVFLLSSNHPRGYGNFARLLGRYVREEQLLTLPEAVRRLTSLPARNLGLADRGRLAAGYAADIVVFDPGTIADHATFREPKRYATGVSEVVVNGVLALERGEPTGAKPGRFVRGRAWAGHAGGGCRASSRDWDW